VISEIKAALVETGRSIDEDHYGAAFAFHFGRVDDPGVAQVMEAYRKRTGRDPERHFAIGDAGMMLDRIAQYVEAGASKFILRPAARGDVDMLDQTRKLIEQVLPMVAARWPKQKKAA
jgi:hypothetical protein